MISVILGIGLAAFCLSGADRWLGIKLSAWLLAQPLVMAWIAGITIAVILIAGLYPAFVQSAFNPWIH